MTDTSRRTFISLAGLGTVAGVAVAVAPSSSAAAPPAEDTTLPAEAAGVMAAYVHDVRTGEVILLVEGHEVTVTDTVLTARLVRAYAAAAKS